MAAKADDNEAGGQSRVTGTSFESFTDAADAAFRQVPGDPKREGFAAAEVTRLSMSKGGIVGRTQYQVELTRREADHGG